MSVECLAPERVSNAALVENINPGRPLPGAFHKFTNFSDTEGVDTLDPKRIVHSHSSIDGFITCARQYQAKFITKEVVFVGSEHTAYGNRAHDALERRIRDGVALPEEFSQLEGMCVGLLAIEGERLVEKKLAISDDIKSASYYDKEMAWFRGKGDLTIIQKHKRRIMTFDYKTSKPKKDKKQLERMALLTLRNFPHIEIDTVKSTFIYTKTGDVDSETIFVDELEGRVVAELKLDIARVEAAIAKNEYPPNPSGLCNGWCEGQACKFWKPKRAD